MKYVKSAFILIFCAILLSGCSSQDLNAICIEDTGFYFEESQVFLLNSFEELENCRAEMSERFDYAGHDSLKKQFDAYDSSYFADKMLIVFISVETSGSYKLSVKDISYSDSEMTIHLKRKIPRKNLTEDMKNWYIFVEVPKNEEITNVNISVYEK